MILAERGFCESGQGSGIRGKEMKAKTNGKKTNEKSYVTLPE
jgi:hypothetical protein